MASKFIIIALFAGMTVRAAGGEFFIAPQGTAQGNGSRLLPWDIVTALADNTKTENVNNVVKPGDTIWLRGGTYGTGSNWLAKSTLTGTSNQPIVLRQYLGERAVINGGISALGAWTTFWGFEIMNSSTNRHVTTDNRQPGLNLLGVGHRCINLIIHDVGHPGIGFWSIVGNGGEIYGCLLWNNGIYSYDPGYTNNVRGSAIYAQNDSGSRYITDTISFKNFSTGMKAYTEQGHAEGFNLSGNVTFGNDMDGYLIEATHNAITNAVFTNNIGYNNGMSRLGIYGVQHKNILIANNYFVAEAGGYWNFLYCRGWTNFVFTNNVFVDTATGTNTYPPGSGVRYQSSMTFWNIVRSNGTYNVNGNKYYGGDELYGNFSLDTLGRTWFRTIQTNVGWETTGERYSNSSTYSYAKPAQNIVVLRTNKYERGRANLAIFNWQTNNSANVDISSVGLAQGQSFEVRDVQNFLGTPALTAIYDSAHPTISVPLNLTNCSQLIGGQHHYRRDPNLHTDPVFNTFVILPLIRQTSPVTGLHVLSSQ